MCFEQHEPGGSAESGPLPGEQPSNVQGPRQPKATPEDKARGDAELVAASEQLLTDVWLPEDATATVPQVYQLSNIL